jgi:hypothetical protein
MKAKYARWSNDGQKPFGKRTWMLNLTGFTGRRRIDVVEFEDTIDIRIREVHDRLPGAIGGGGALLPAGGEPPPPPQPTGIAVDGLAARLHGRRPA